MSLKELERIWSESWLDADGIKQEALGRIVKKRARKILSKSRVPSGLFEADEVPQWAYEKMHNRWLKEERVRNPGAIATLIAQDVIADRLRRDRCQTRAERQAAAGQRAMTLDAVPSVDAPVEKQVIDRMMMVEFIGSLSDQQRKVFWGRALGLSYEEIAEEFDIPDTAISQQLSRAKDKAKDYFDRVWVVAGLGWLLNGARSKKQRASRAGQQTSLPGSAAAGPATAPAVRRVLHRLVRNKLLSGGAAGLAATVAVAGGLVIYHPWAGTTVRPSGPGAPVLVTTHPPTAKVSPAPPPGQRGAAPAGTSVPTPPSQAGAPPQETSTPLPSSPPHGRATAPPSPPPSQNRYTAPVVFSGPGALDFSFGRGYPSAGSHPPGSTAVYGLALHPQIGQCPTSARCSATALINQATGNGEGDVVFTVVPDGNIVRLAGEGVDPSNNQPQTYTATAPNDTRQRMCFTGGRFVEGDPSNPSHTGTFTVSMPPLQGQPSRCGTGGTG